MQIASPRSNRVRSITNSWFSLDVIERPRLKFSKSQFASFLDKSVFTFRNWNQLLLVVLEHVEASCNQSELVRSRFSSKSPLIPRSKSTQCWQIMSSKAHSSRSRFFSAVSSIRNSLTLLSHTSIKKSVIQPSVWVANSRFTVRLPTSALVGTVMGGEISKRSGTAVPWRRCSHLQLAANWLKTIFNSYLELFAVHTSAGWVSLSLGAVQSGDYRINPTEP